MDSSGYYCGNCVFAALTDVEMKIWKKCQKMCETIFAIVTHTELIITRPKTPFNDIIMDRIKVSLGFFCSTAISLCLTEKSAHCKQANETYQPFCDYPKFFLSVPITMYSSLFLLNERGYSISVQFSLYCSELFV